MGWGGFILGTGMPLRGPCLISRRCLCTFLGPHVLTCTHQSSSPGWSQAPTKEGPIHFAFPS